MKRSLATLLALISAAIYLSCSAIPGDDFIRFPREIDSGEAYQGVDNGLAATQQSRISFQDRTQEIVGDALTMIKRNQSDGAPLDQRWYAFRRFGENLDQILRATELRFYGGREADVQSELASQYISVIPVESNQDPGEIRLFTARRDKDSFDVVIIGQNGREVALKTVIRIAYLFKFMDEKFKQTFVGGLDSFLLRRVKIFLSTMPPEQEFISFFQQYRITDPDAVIIGFQSDTRSYLNDIGISDLERYSTDSLKINWYPNANGKKVLLVSINGNRIFASRTGDLIKAMLESFRSPPQTLVFFGSAGAIDAAYLVGQIVAPTVVVNDEYFNSDQPGGKLAHVIHNRAATLVRVKTAHVSVESMVSETTTWAAAKRKNRIMTVDQELYHLVNAVNTSPYGGEIRLYVGILITDNVSTVRGHHESTLQYAEDIITQTGATRRSFLATVLAEVGITRDRSIATRSDTKLDAQRNSGVSGW